MNVSPYADDVLRYAACQWRLTVSDAGNEIERAAGKNGISALRSRNKASDTTVMSYL